MSLGLGFVAAGMAGSLWTFALLHGVLIGLFGSSAMFAPLIADTSALVHPAPRHRGRDLRQRQLHCGCDLAAGGATFRRRVRLARDPISASGSSAGCL